jgi:putative phosphoribosyl transferase
VETQSIQIPFKNGILSGDLEIPRQPKGIVLFAHGSGSSRLSPRNRFVARVLSEAGFVTGLFDLLTLEEEKVDELTGELRFNIELLTERLIIITHFLQKDQRFAKLRLGYFGSSTGAAAALKAAVSAVVSRGGRPDLAMDELKEVEAPVLLIVGGHDFEVIKLNQLAYDQLSSDKELVIIESATHLFEEKGALEQVAHQAKEWMIRYLP